MIFRKGICPAHAWVADAAETGPALPTALLLNGHFGALLVAKLIVPLFPLTDSLFPVLSYLAILRRFMSRSARLRRIRPAACSPFWRSASRRVF